MDEFVRISDDIMVRRKDILAFYSTSYYDNDKGSCKFYCKMDTTNSSGIILYNVTIGSSIYLNKDRKKTKEKEIFDDFLIRIEKLLSTKDKVTI